MSLDHDLGDRLEPGVKVLDWLEEQAHFDPEFRRFTFTPRTRTAELS
jgi:hypothetical protein